MLSSWPSHLSPRISVGGKAGGGGAFHFVAQGKGDGSQSTNPFSMNTTGATFLCGVISSDGATPGITDSNSNTWHLLTAQTASGNQVLIAYAFGVTVGASHSFTVTNGTAQLSFIYAFSGPAVTTSACFTGAQNGTVTTTQSLQPGSVTPVAGGVVLTGFAGILNGSAGSTINSSFNTPQISSANVQGAASYLITATNAAVNPTWTMGSAGSTGSVIAAFVPA